MSAKLKVLIGLLAFALFITVAACGYSWLAAKYQPSADTSPLSSPTDKGSQDPAPDFTVTDNSGNQVSLSAFKGKPIVLNFWTSWCPSCKAEMPDYEKTYQQYSAKGVVFIMVDLTDGSRETMGTARQFISDSHYTFPVYYDIKGDAMRAYSVSTIPNSFFIDKNGNIVNFYQGMIDAGTMEKNIEKILQ